LTKKQIRDYIRISKKKGSRKASLDFSVRNEAGKVVHRITARVSDLRPDRRRKKNWKYVRLCSLDPDGVLGITKHVWSGNISFVIKPHARFLSETLSTDKLGKILAAIYVMGHPTTYDENDISDLSRISDRVISQKSHTSKHSELELVTGYYVQEFQERIKKGKTAFKISLSHHRRNR
jgi:hypothetical protein